MEYIAVVHKEKKSDYGVSFPDFPGCVTAGKNLEEAKEMAQEALEGHIAAMKEAGLSISAPSNLDEAVAATQDEYKGTICAYFVVQVKGKREIVRFNATMENNLLHEIDATAKSLGLTRSAFLARAAHDLIEETRNN